MKLLARINKAIRLLELKYAVFVPNEYVYDTLNEISLLVQFNGEVYRLDGIKRGTEITRDLVYSAIENRNRTWIAKYRGTIEGHVQYMKDRNGYSGIALSEVNVIK